MLSICTVHVIFQTMTTFKKHHMIKNNNIRHIVSSYFYIISLYMIQALYYYSNLSSTRFLLSLFKSHNQNMKTFQWKKYIIRVITL